MTDDDRQDGKKRGLFSRLFGRKPEAAPAPQPAENEQAPVPPQEAPEPQAAEEAPLPESTVTEIVATEPAAPQPTPVSAPEPEVEPEEPEPEVEEPEPGVEEPEPGVEEPEVEEPPAKGGWWQRLKAGLSRTSSSIGSGIAGIFTRRKLDDTTLEELEDILIQADLGVAMATRVTEAVGKGRYDKSIEPEEVKAILAREIAAVLESVARPLAIDTAKKPFVILMVGVNGSGKTTTIGKLAQKFRAEGRSVMLAAGDTFRAAAIEQLSVWGERTGARVIRREQGADAAGLAFDALKEAQESATDVLLIDTAGRLQNKAGLMAELEKIIRVVRKRDESAPHAVLLVLDATTGQNAISQVDIFGQMAGVTGLVMTKLDGTARGGILVAIADKFGLPVHFIGVGEGVDDLEPFAATDFARAVAGLDEHERP
ncbi:fused signal recognition particle receptor [Pseudochelatococcus lubricantis]|uniref:Signal recognition particle receptor FtsY n=1 Tax=Pseudochelatococcus lubricantis TaxID=1538102 RepID=A0ABX0UWG1_9HYPH|nr:signal recognition particle-docking protein FtsY [Pseudochelatococcus lubricantis]NIJ57296.1 fused signal recognition particle receptor [Pseudochelatococcus lubricantis]